MALDAVTESAGIICAGLTAPGALPLAQRLRLPPGPTTVVAPTPKPAACARLGPPVDAHGVSIDTLLGALITVGL